jgi:hypothetical protein
VPLHGVAASGPVAVVRGAEARELNERVWRKYLTTAGRAHPGLGERIAEHDDVTLRITPGPWRSWSTAADFAGAYEVPGLLFSLAPTDR